MPVGHLTYHAYGSWLPDRPQGYVERHRGILPTSKPLARYRRKVMTQRAFVFDFETQRLLTQRFIDICDEEGYRAHAAAGDESHLHLLVSFKQSDLTINSVSAPVKNLLSLHLSRSIGPVGRKWFCKGASKQRVNDQAHFDYLVNKYFPDHRGVFWCEETGWREDERMQS